MDHATFGLPMAAPITPLAQRMMSATSKGPQKPAVLVLADGTSFMGWSCGAVGTAVGEVCFNTSMEGYFEVITDPSYAGQIVTMSYPHVGNYGVNTADAQRATSALRALVVRSMCYTPSSWRSTMSLPDYLAQAGVVAIEGIDTRALVRHVRQHGAQMGIVSSETLDYMTLAQQLARAPQLVGTNLVATVSCKHPHRFCVQDIPADRHFALAAAHKSHYRVVAYDCGIKTGILESLALAGCEVEVVPWDTPAHEVLARTPHGVFFSNGPGDPQAVPQTYEQVKKLLGKVPVFGICLGHQMLGLACGAQVEKLRFGHRGANHPVMNLMTHKVEITAQNHGFGLVFSSLGALVPQESGGITEHPTSEDLRFWVERGCAPVVYNERVGRIRLTHVNLNDGTMEGMQLLDAQALSVQYHPEASPGPTDARYLFEAFTRLMQGDAAYLNVDIAARRLAGWTFDTPNHTTREQGVHHA